MRLCSAAEAQAVDEAGGLVESNGSGIFGPPIASATRIFPAEKLPVMKVNPPFDDLGKYGHLIEIELRQGWNIPANGAIVGRDGFGSTVSVPQINQFIQSIKVGPRS